MKTRAVHRRTRVSSFLLILGVASVALTLALTVQVRSASDSVPVVDPTASELLEDAREALPFAIQQPVTVPDGYQLGRIMWIEPDPALGTTRSSIDTWFYNGTGDWVHIWQTDIPPDELGDDDPTVIGAPTRIAGTEWSLVENHLAYAGKSLSVISVRLQDGTTLSMDSPGGFELIARFAASLQGLGAGD